MDKVDSHKFKMPIDQAYQFEADADIDEIKNVSKLKDLLSKNCYIFFLKKQKIINMLLKVKIV